MPVCGQMYRDDGRPYRAYIDFSNVQMSVLNHDEAQVSTTPYSDMNDTLLFLLTNIVDEIKPMSDIIVKHSCDCKENRS
jgi:hypothetical protein